MRDARVGCGLDAHPYTSVYHFGLGVGVVVGGVGGVVSALLQSAREQHSLLGVHSSPWLRGQFWHMHVLRSLYCRAKHRLRAQPMHRASPSSYISHVISGSSAARQGGRGTPPASPSGQSRGASEMV